MDFKRNSNAFPIQKLLLKAKNIDCRKKDLTSSAKKVFRLLAIYFVQINEMRMLNKSLGRPHAHVQGPSINDVGIFQGRRVVSNFDVVARYQKVGVRQIRVKTTTGERGVSKTSQKIPTSFMDGPLGRRLMIRLQRPILERQLRQSVKPNRYSTVPTTCLQQ